MKLVIMLCALFALPPGSYASGNEGNPESFPSNNAAMRLRVYKTLGISSSVYTPLEEHVPDGRDHGLAFLRDYVGGLYPLGTNRRNILTDLRRILEATKDLPGRKLAETERYIQVTVIYKAKSPQTDIVWLTIGTLSFKFNLQGMLEQALYLESARPADKTEQDSPDKWMTPSSKSGNQ